MIRVSNLTTNYIKTKLKTFCTWFCIRIFRTAIEFNGKSTRKSMEKITLPKNYIRLTESHELGIIGISTFKFNVSSEINEFFFQNATRLALQTTRQFSQTSRLGAGQVPQGYKDLKVIQESFQVRKILVLLRL